jgi:alcohol dehydrogenase (NADP+)
MRAFRPAADGVDPSRVPARTLETGAKMPAVGLGTFGSDRFPGDAVAEAVGEAAEVGYRHFDCAAVYGNERLIGEAFRSLQVRGLARSEFWVTSKLWNDKHAEADVIPACEQTLRDLQLDYLDLYLVHWPFPNYHAPGVSVEARDPHAVPYLHARYMRTWRQLEKLVDMGLVRHIGTSNMTAAKLELLLRDAEIKPVANEMELHPHFQQPELFEFVRARGLVPIGFCPIGSPTRPERDRTPDDTVDIQDPLIVRLAGRLGIHPAEVCVKWAVQRGQVPIPFSVSREQYLGNLRAAVGEPLAEAEMQAIASIDRRCRLIKGQVFLWEGARGWEDLWDEDGTIAGA